MTLRFSEKFYHPFSPVFIFGNTFHESHGLVVVPVTSSNNFVSLHQLDVEKLEHVSLIQLVTCIATKPRLSGNVLPNIKIYENGGSIFSENLRVVVKNIALVNSIHITKSINLL